MKKLQLILSILCLILTINSAQAELRDLPHVTVLADSSLTNPITELIRLYSQENMITVTASYDESFDQARKIKEGESADIFISSHPVWMSEIKQMGLIDVYSLSNLVQNKLTLAISKKSRLNNYPIPKEGLEKKIKYLSDRSIMVFGEPESTSLGIYSKGLMSNLDKNPNGNLWDELKGKMLHSLSAKNNLYLISQGETSGITYYSDVHKNDEVSVLEVIDEDLYDPILYQAAVVAGENMAAARGFLKFLQSKEAKKIFHEYGFVVD